VSASVRSEPDTRIDEIAPNIYRVSTYVSDGPPGGICFNQFLIDDDEPVLVHTGMRMHATATIDAVASVLAPEKIRWITSTHASRPDEFGALSEWFAAAPHAQVFHGQVGCWVNLHDASDRPLRALDDEDAVEVGNHRVRWLATPHVPGPWEAGILVEETTGTMFCGDLFARAGRAEPCSDADIVDSAIRHAEMTHGFARTPDTAPTLRRLAANAPARLALMHGPVFGGDTAAALNGLACWFANDVTDRLC
jgi:flavorubredoxin